MFEELLTAAVICLLGGNLVGCGIIRRDVGKLTETMDRRMVACETTVRILCREHQANHGGEPIDIK